METLFFLLTERLVRFISSLSLSLPLLPLPLALFLLLSMRVTT